MKSEKLDIIIPAYKAQNTIYRTLASIAMQAIIDDIEVTIVNDCDGSDYQDYINYYSKFFKIKEIKMPENGENPSWTWKNCATIASFFGCVNDISFFYASLNIRYCKNDGWGVQYSSKLNYTLSK